MTRKWTIACVALWLAVGCVAWAADEPTKLPVWSQVDIQVYGRIKADASYDSGRVEPGDYVKWVTGENYHETNLTANETRLGLNIKGPDIGSIKTSGKVEMDFYGNTGIGSNIGTVGDAENKGKPMMRHAYMVFTFPNKWSLLAGQTSDIVSPLAPRTLSYTVLWYTGNIGYRRPQIRLTREYNLCKDTYLKFDAGVSRTIGENTIDVESGENSAAPTVQGRVGLTTPLIPKAKPATIGLSGSYGKEEYWLEEWVTWSFNVDVVVPLCAHTTLKGEYFTGENLDAFLGGIGQGFNKYQMEGIGGQGGWMAAEVEAGKGWSLTGGFGVDDPDHGDLKGMAPTTTRDRNLCVFGNVIYAVTKNTKVGFELSQWRTDYLNGTALDDTRGQLSFIYEF